MNLVNPKIRSGDETKTTETAPTQLKCDGYIYKPKLTTLRVPNLKYESVRIDSKTVVFIRANPGKKETTEGSGSNVNLFGNSALFGSGKSRKMVRDQYQAMGLVISQNTYPHRPNV